jgi:hypothetical protein
MQLFNAFFCSPTLTTGVENYWKKNLLEHHLGYFGAIAVHLPS